jgi:hypothetical protein
MYLGMSDKSQFIYLSQNMQVWWFDDDGIPNDEGIGTPHRLCKVGKTDNLPRRLDEYNNGNNTGYRLPKPYRFVFGMRVNNMRAAEDRAHDILKSMGRHCSQGHKELGTEWFYTTPEIAREVFESIREEFDGVFTASVEPRPDRVIPPPIPTFDVVREKNRRAGLTSSEEYMDHPNTTVRDPKNTFSREWRGWYHFLGVDTSRFPPTKEEWVRVCKEKGLVSRHQYELYDGPDLPKNPRHMYLNFTKNWNDEMGRPDEIVW